MKVIELLKKAVAEKKKHQQERQENYLLYYFSKLYARNDRNIVAIPYFIKADETLKSLKRRGLVNDVYNYIQKKGEKVA